eukprot:161287_1
MAHDRFIRLEDPIKRQVGMDLSIYNEIIASKGIDPEFIESHTQIPMGKLWFHQDILRGKAMWSDNVWYDWKIWLYNNHSLLSLCLATKHHPYSTKWRIYTLISTLLASTIFIAITSRLLTINSLKESKYGLFASRFGISTGNTIFLLILDRSLMYLSICPCSYDKKRKCYHCCLQTAVIMRCFYIFITVGCFIGSIVMNTIFKTWMSWLELYIVGWCVSYAISVITISLSFIKYYRKDKKIYNKLMDMYENGMENSEFQQLMNVSKISVFEYLQHKQRNETWTMQPSKMHIQDLSVGKLETILNDDDVCDNDEAISKGNIKTKAMSKLKKGANHVINSMKSESYNAKPSFLINHNGKEITLTEMKCKENKSESEQNENDLNEVSKSSDKSVDI